MQSDVYWSFAPSFFLVQESKTDVNIKKLFFFNFPAAVYVIKNLDQEEQLLIRSLNGAFCIQSWCMKSFPAHIANAADPKSA